MPKPLDIRGNSFSWHSLDQQSLNLRTLDVQVQPARKFHIKSASNKRPGLHSWSQLVFNLHCFIYTCTNTHIQTCIHIATHMYPYTSSAQNSLHATCGLSTLPFQSEKWSLSPTPSCVGTASAPE